MEKNKKSRLKFKGSTFILKDDDYETPMEILKDILPYIKDYNIIYDPFYCKGTIIKEWEKLNKICINENKDAFNRIQLIVSVQNGLKPILINYNL